MNRRIKTIVIALMMSATALLSAGCMPMTAGIDSICVIDGVSPAG